MKHLRQSIYFVLPAFIILLASCHKDKDAAPAAGIEGYWVGKWGGGTTTPANGYAFVFRSNGTARVFDGMDTATASKAEGTYTLSGSTLQVTYQYDPASSILITSSIVNAGFTHTDGSWGIFPSTTDGGTFFIDKQ